MKELVATQSNFCVNIWSLLNSKYQQKILQTNAVFQKTYFDLFYNAAHI